MLHAVRIFPEPRVLSELGKFHGLDESVPGPLVRGSYRDPPVRCLESLIGSRQRMGRTQRPR